MLDRDLNAYADQIRADGAILRILAGELAVDIKTLVEFLRRECDHASADGERGEDRQLDARPDAVQATNAKWSEPPFTLDPSELPLNRCATTVDRRPPRRLSPDTRVQAARRNPH